MRNGEPADLLLKYGIDPARSLSDRTGCGRRSCRGRGKQLQLSAETTSGECS
jgi:hypothetical protein